MERWVFSFRSWKIVIIKDGLLYYGRAVGGDIYYDTSAYISFNEAKDEAIELAKKAGVTI